MAAQKQPCKACRLLERSQQAIDITSMKKSPYSARQKLLRNKSKPGRLKGERGFELVTRVFSLPLLNGPTKMRFKPGSLVVKHYNALAFLVREFRIQHTVLNAEATFCIDSYTGCVCHFLRLDISTYK